MVGQGGKLTIYLGFFNIDCFGCYNIHNTKVTFITATQGQEGYMGFLKIDCMYMNHT